MYRICSAIIRCFLITAASKLQSLLCGIAVGLLFASPAIGNEPVFLNTWGSYGTGYLQFNGPTGITVSSTGQVYVVDSGNHRIQRFSEAGTYELQWGTYGIGNGEFSHPHGVAVGASGQVFVTDTDNDRVQRFSADGTYDTQWGYSGTGYGEFDGPVGVGVSPTGLVYVAEFYNSRFQRFSADGWFDGVWGGYGSGDGQFSGAWGVAVSPTGEVYVSDFFGSRIQRFSADGTYETKWGTYGGSYGQFDEPSGVAVSANDRVYVADTKNHRIQRFTADGGHETRWGSYGTGTGEFDETGGVAVSPTGLVYVTDFNNHRVQQFFDYAAWVDPATHYLPDSIEFDSEFYLDAGKHLNVPDTTTVSNTWLRLNGGSLNSQSIDLIGSGLYYESGTLTFQNLNAGLLYVGAGSPLPITQGMVAHPDDLAVEANGVLLLSGGEALANGSASAYAGAVVAVTSGRFGAGNIIYNFGDIQLGDQLLARVTATTIDSSGVIRGSGRVEASLINQGEVRVAAGEKLRIGLNGGGSHSNTGRIEASGNPQYGGPAEIEFTDPLINSAGTGLIAVRNATLRFNGGLTNQGSLAFSFGTSDVFGDVTNVGNISVLGGAEVTFYDDVNAAGGSLVISHLGSTNSKVVMLGSYSGGFSGGGELYAFGDLRPGNSPAAVTMGGNLFLGPSTNTVIELGGTTAGDEFDQLLVDGLLALDGRLGVELLPGYTPTFGDSFHILDWTSRSGEFATLDLPSLVGGLTWNTSRLYTDGVISIAAALPGDYNGDGLVNAADYTVWRDTYSGSNVPASNLVADGDGDNDVDQADYGVWTANFGRTTGGASNIPANLDADAAVPEPTSVALLMLTCAGAIFWRTHPARRWHLLAASTLALALPTGAVRAAVTYDAGADFSVIENPHGVWRYGWYTSPTAEFHVYPTSADNGSLKGWYDPPITVLGAPAVFKNFTSETYSSGTVSILGEQLAFHPGNVGQYSVVRWIAPQSGLIEIAAAFTGRDLWGTTTDVHVLHNGVPLFDGTVNGFATGPAPFETTRDVLAGDTIDFTVGYSNGSFFNDTTSIEGVIVSDAGLLTGDYNRNGVVDAADYPVWRDSYSGPNVPASNLVADGDGDSDVDQADYAVWTANFATTSGSASNYFEIRGTQSPVPEPATLSLFLLIALTMVSRGWKLYRYRSWEGMGLTPNKMF